MKEEELKEKEVRAPIIFGKALHNKKRTEMINNLRKNVISSSLTLHEVMQF